MELTQDVRVVIDGPRVKFVEHLFKKHEHWWQVEAVVMVVQIRSKGATETCAWEYNINHILHGILNKI